MTCPDAASIVIKPYQADDLKEIEKAIRSSDLGLAPNNDGKVIRLTVPTMSGDQRKKIVQQIKKQAEAAKVSCRNIRRDSNKHFDDAEKAKTMTEDDRDKGKTKVQDLLKAYEGKIDALSQYEGKGSDGAVGSEAGDSSTKGGGVRPRLRRLRITFSRASTTPQISPDAATSHQPNRFERGAWVEYRNACSFPSVVRITNRSPWSMTLSSQRALFWHPYTGAASVFNSETVYDRCLP